MLRFNAIGLALAVTALSSQSSAFTREEVTDRSKPIWTDFTLRLYDPFISQTAFGGLNTVLCLFNRSGYKDFVNFKKVEGDEVPSAYLANLNDDLCGSDESDIPRIFRVEQDDSDSPLTIESWVLPDTTGADNRAKIVLEEEVSDANPYGIMQLAWNIVGENGDHIYSWSSSSEKLDAGAIQYKTVTWADLVLVGSALPMGAIFDFYSANIIHNENGTGYGSVTARRSPSYSAFPSSVFKIVDMAYNSDLMLVKDKLNVLSETCLSRESFWEYVGSDGYGVYDVNGDRVGPVNVTYENSGVLEEFTVSGGASGSVVNIPGQFRSREDGAPVAEGTLNSGFFPRFSLPDGAILIGEDQQEYLVRVLKPYTVYAHLDNANCTDAGLVFNESLLTPDLDMIDRLPGDVPAVGAVLLNDFELGDSQADPVYSGAVYLPDADEDEDGVLNYNDAFPLDPLKSTDADYDGVDDAEDTEVLQSSLLVPEYPEEMLRESLEGTLDF